MTRIREEEEAYLWSSFTHHM